MSTAANVKEIKSGHWYAKDGTPMYSVIAKSTGQPRPTTLADARTLSLLPSVTYILDQVLRKPALEAWKTEQAVLACLTTPRNNGEELDAFIKRVLSEERQQDQESKAAMDRGAEIHDAMELKSQDKPISAEIMPWVMPAWEAVRLYGPPMAAEKVLVGNGYAGRCDLLQDGGGCLWLWDYKTTKKLPDPEKGGAWTEHRLQLSAYAAAVLGGVEHKDTIRTANCYISTVDCGKFVICQNPPWQDTFERGFAPILKHWQWSTGYQP